ncbi:quercetin dioxygenase-like cupin family protein [Bosea sp. BK604]|nr:quercetin dioxygenase-like cupin family protein [Bosea sp. BK604]
MAFSFWRSRGDEPPILVPAIGLELSVRLPPTTNRGAMTVIETVNAPGYGPPRHRHPETELFRVMEGRYLYEIDGRRFFADAGDLVSVPGGASHGFVNVTDRPARQLIMILPGLDAERFFTELGEIMQHGVPDRARLNEFGRRWNMEFLGPPVNAGDGPTEP